LHDAGKISIPESILDKSTKITEGNINEIKERFQNIKHYIKSLKLEKNEEIEKLKEIKETLEFIENVNKVNFVSEEDAKKLMRIAELKYIDVD